MDSVNILIHDSLDQPTIKLSTADESNKIVSVSKSDQNPLVAVEIGKYVGIDMENIAIDHDFSRESNSSTNNNFLNSEDALDNNGTKDNMNDDLILNATKSSVEQLKSLLILLQYRHAEQDKIIKSQYDLIESQSSAISHVQKTLGY